MSNDTKFIDGLRFKEPNERAPEYVKAKGSIKVADLLAWLQQQSGEWVNFDVKVSNGGKWYAAVDNWKPNNGTPRNNAPQQIQPAPLCGAGCKIRWRWPAKQCRWARQRRRSCCWNLCPQCRKL